MRLQGAGLIVGALSLALGTVAQATESLSWTRDVAIREIRRLETSADSIYIADARYRPAHMDAQLRLIALVDGRKPPKRLFGWGYTANRVDDGTVIVFAERIGRKHFPYQPWRWGRWRTTYLYPGEILDAEFAARLPRTADRLDSSATG